MANLVLRVNGRDFSGWKSVRVTRGIDAICGGFDLEVTDRWAGQSEPWPIVEEDECKVLLGGQVVITGYVDKRSLSFGATEHTLRVSGRDKAAALVDCSAVSPWAYRSLPLLDLARRIATPHGISVSLAPGLDLPTPPAKFTVDPGEGAFDALDRACKAAGVLPVSDGAGGVVLTRAGVTRAVTALVQGENILSASAEYDATARYRRYVVTGQHQGSDAHSGAAVASVSGEAQDETVRRSTRVLYVRPEAGTTREQAKIRAQWEAKVRAGRGDSITVTVQGWTQGDGSLWPVNALVQLRAPLLGMDAELLITQAVHTLDQGGTTTQLMLRRPDAYDPEPTVKKPGTGRPGRPGGLWKEIAHGA